MRATAPSKLSEADSLTYGLESEAAYDAFCRLRGAVYAVYPSFAARNTVERAGWEADPMAAILAAGEGGDLGRHRPRPNHQVEGFQGSTHKAMFS